MKNEKINATAKISEKQSLRSMFFKHCTIGGSAYREFAVTYLNIKTDNYAGVISRFCREIRAEYKLYSSLVETGNDSQKDWVWLFKTDKQLATACQYDETLLDKVTNKGLQIQQSNGGWLVSIIED